MKNHLVIFIETGQATVHVDDDCVEMNAGDVIWIPPGVTRQTFKSKSCIVQKDYRLHFELKHNGFALRFADSAIHRSDAWSILPIFRLLNRSFLYPGKFEKSTAQGLLLTISSMFLSLNDNSRQRTFSFSEQTKLDTYIRQQTGSIITLAELADVVQLTPDYFSRKFKNTYQVSPRTYIKSHRIHLAASCLLESSLSIKELAYEFGYDDVNFFCRQFKEVMHCTPMQYRKQF